MRFTMQRSALLLAAFLFVPAVASAQDTPADAKAKNYWANWRGPTGNGVAKGNPPLEWSEDKNVRWKVAIPGEGISTPIVWGDRIYLTLALKTDREGKAATPPANEGADRGGRRGGRRGRRGRSEPLTKIYEFCVLALDRKDGSIVWRTKVHEAVPHERGHSTGSQASNSPITDGKHIYAHFGSRGIHCLDMKGEIVWQKQLGTMRTRNQFGEGSSPALHGNTLIVNWDHEGDSFVVAFDKKSGDELWRKKRDEVTSWSTPRVIEVDGKPQAIISATTASRGYDLATGEVIWECGGMTTNAIPTPCYENGVLYVMSGFRGAALQAIKLAGAKDDLEITDNILWEHGAGTSYVPSALLYKGKLWFLRVNTGRVSCLRAKDGTPVYEGKSLPGIRQIYASPIGAAGRVYFTSRNGLTVVIDAGDEFKELAANELDDTVDASLVVVDDEIFIRGRKSLYCISEK